KWRICSNWATSWGLPKTPSSFQLFHRDIPALCQALDLSTQVALLKGRSNYLCHYHFDAAGKDEGVFGSPQEVAQFEQIRHFMQQTQTGDKSELAAVPEQAPI